MATMAIDTKEEAKELHGLLRKAKKAASSTTGGEGECVAELLLCVNILSLLKSLPVSAEAIVSSQAGNLLKPLKKHQNPKIRSLVSDINAIWSTRVHAALSSNRSETKNQFKKVVTATPSTQLETNRKRSKNLIANARVPTSVLVKTNEPKRDWIRKQLQDCFSKVLREMSTQLQGAESLDPARVAVEVEDVLFKKWGKAGADKSNNAKYRSLLFNIRDPKNVDFRRRLLVGEIKAAEVAGLRTEDMGSEGRRHEAKVMAEMALLRRIVGVAEKGTSQEYECERCGKRDASYGQMQTRSADEPMTTYLTCMACDNHWKLD